MTRRLNSITLTAVFLVAGASSSGQEMPDFSGTWIMDMSRSETAAQSAQVAPDHAVTHVITQSSDHLTIETRVDGRQDVVRFSFAMPEAANAADAADTSGSELGVDLQDAFAKWVDDRLVTTTWLEINGKAVTRIQTWSLDPTRRELTVETVLRVEHGYRGDDPSNTNQLRDVYLKVTP